MEIRSVAVEKPEEINFILGQSHFIKTVEDIYEAMVNTNPDLRFGIAFCEASMKCLIRWTGNDDEMTELAKRNAEKIGAGHSFIIFMKNGFPINVLPRIKTVPEVCRIFCATSNPTDILIAENERGRGILGVIDGSKPSGIEGMEDQEWRRDFLRKIGYKQ
jgi:adenosine/AMP kinase